MRVQHTATDQSPLSQPSYLVGGIFGAISALHLMAYPIALSRLGLTGFPKIIPSPVSSCDVSYFMIMTPLAFGAITGVFRTAIDRYNSLQKSDRFGILGGDILASGLASFLLAITAMTSYPLRASAPFIAMAYIPGMFVSAEAARLANSLTEVG